MLSLEIVKQLLLFLMLLLTCQVFTCCAQTSSNETVADLIKYYEPLLLNAQFISDDNVSSDYGKYFRRIEVKTTPENWQNYTDPAIADLGYKLVCASFLWRCDCEFVYMNCDKKVAVSISIERGTIDDPCYIGPSSVEFGYYGDLETADVRCLDDMNDFNKICNVLDY